MWIPMTTKKAELGLALEVLDSTIPCLTDLLYKAGEGNEAGAIIQAVRLAGFDPDSTTDLTRLMQIIKNRVEELGGDPDDIIVLDRVEECWVDPEDMGFWEYGHGD